MEKRKIYKDIADRTGGDIYIGVVGPVRCGKSTFINRFMESAVIPNISGEYDKKRARDELPQCAKGKTVMTAEPKFIPDSAVDVSFGDEVNVKLRLIDCVGYMIPDALGATEDGAERMVKTPWSDEPMPFEKAAEQGTYKVMTEHSTVGMLVTCDGTIGEIPREGYVQAEERLVNEMKAIGKPFVIILNSSEPLSEGAEKLAMSLEEKYSCPVALVNCLELNVEDAEGIIEMLLYEFPISLINVKLPSWIGAVSSTHALNGSILNSIREVAAEIRTLSDARRFADALGSHLSERIEGVSGENTCNVKILSSDLSNGTLDVSVDLCEELYYKIICDLTGVCVTTQSELIETLVELSEVKAEFEKYKEAICQLESGGYGIVMPKIGELTIDEPEVIRNAGAYGVKLRAKADSVHLIKAAIETEINPIVGTQEQAEEIIQRLISEYEEDPSRLWNSNIFGKSLYELVNDGLRSKMDHLTPQSKEKLSETLSRIVNESSNGLICILL